MESTWLFVANSALLGVGLAADAFSVSVVNGIQYPHIRSSKAVLIAGAFAFFQALMPLGGWFLTHTIMDHFKAFQRCLPWISQLFLAYLGVKMIAERGHQRASGADEARLTLPDLLFQAVATSIDALLVGFALAQYSLSMASACALIIAAVTFLLCFLGVHWGRELGLKLAGKAAFFGGAVLLVIAAEHFIRMLAAG